MEIITSNNKNDDANYNGNFNKLAILILTILGVTDGGKKVLNYTRGQALTIYRRLILTLIIISVMYFLGFIINVVGFKGLNYFPFIAFVMASGILRIHPVHNAIVAFFGALIEALETNSSLSKGAIKYLQYYQGYFSQFISYGALVFWALAVIPLEGNAMNSLAIFSTIVMLLIMGIGGSLCRYLINIFVITVLIYFSYQAVSQSFKDFTSTVSTNTETVCGLIYKNFIDYLNKPDKTDEPKDKVKGDNTNTSEPAKIPWTEGYYVLSSHHGEATTADFIKAADNCYFNLRWDDTRFNHFKVITKSGKEFSPEDVKTDTIFRGGLRGEEIKIIPTENKELVLSLQVLRA